MTLKIGEACPNCEKIVRYPLSHVCDQKDISRLPSSATNDVTLRDYFAAKAMAALISALSTPAKGRGKHICPDLEETAKSAYEYADALLKEGAK